MEVGATVSRSGRSSQDFGMRGVNSGWHAEIAVSSRRKVIVVGKRELAEHAQSVAFGGGDGPNYNCNDRRDETAHQTTAQLLVRVKGKYHGCT